MGEPYFIPDKTMLSDCCGALSALEIFDDTSICRDCKEWAMFISEEDFEDDE